MIVRIDKSFEKDIAKIHDKKFKVKVADTIESFLRAEKPDQIRGIKKLKGFNSYYRIKINEYRIGVNIDKKTVDFARCLHRKDIYKYFPK